MKRILSTTTKHAALGLVLLVSAGCLESPPETPGNLSNPKLVELINGEIAVELSQIQPEKNSVWRPEARQLTEAWMSTIKEVTTRCRFGKNSERRFNQIELDIYVINGEPLLNVYTGLSCHYKMQAPLVMKVKFEKGKAVDALTDGRELRGSINSIRYEISKFAEQTVKADRSRNRDKYFAPGPTKKEIEEEWLTKKP
jgi:hypothetical protein